jgi:hypothetical protein
MSWFYPNLMLHSEIRYGGMFHPVASIQEAASLVTRNHIRSEIIGDWLYCFTNQLVGFQLECIGFWYSITHGAWVYNGREKDGVSACGENLNQIRMVYGCKKLKGAKNV